VRTPLIAITAALVACSADSREQLEPYCDTNEKATVCVQPGVTVDCYEHAQPQTNGTCTLVLESRFEGDLYVAPYTEDIYCCTDLDASGP
jgi:hypothetical protein